MARTVFFRVPAAAEARARWVKALTLGAALMVVSICWLALAAGPAQATTYTVNITSDLPDSNINGQCDVSPTAPGPQCTLRAAIQESNNSTETDDTINFGIPTSASGCNTSTGVCTILVNSALPSVTDRVTIDGYTQNGAFDNSTPGRTSAQLKIELRPNPSPPNPDAVRFISGLEIRGAQNSVIRGLVINSFPRHGILLIFGTASGAQTNGIKIRGNFIGTDPSGTEDRSNGSDGVQVFGAISGNTIGGTSPEHANLISGNSGSGVWLRASGNKVLGNIIGTERDGSSPLGNDFTGVEVDGSSSTVKGNVIAHSRFGPGVELTGFRDDEDDDVRPASKNQIVGNTIFSNDDAGVEIDSINDGPANGNRILSNSIFSNGDLGIDLVHPAAAGVTANDPKDPDKGPNRLQNFPELTSATTNNPDGTSVVRGTLRSRPNQSYTVQFFSSDANDPSGFGEGQQLLGQTKVTTNKKGNASFTFKIARLLTAGHFVSSTATNRSTNDTSEFSLAREITLAR